MAVIYLASSSAGLSSSNLILSGIIVSAILSAGVSFIKYEQISGIIGFVGLMVPHIMRKLTGPDNLPADTGLDFRGSHSAAGRGHPDPGRAAA